MTSLEVADFTGKNQENLEKTIINKMCLKTIDAS